MSRVNIPHARREGFSNVLQRPESEDKWGVQYGFLISWALVTCRRRNERGRCTSYAREKFCQSPPPLSVAHVAITGARSSSTALRVPACIRGSRRHLELPCYQPDAKGKVQNWICYECEYTRLSMTTEYSFTCPES